MDDMREHFAGQSTFGLHLLLLLLSFRLASFLSAFSFSFSSITAFRAFLTSSVATDHLLCLHPANSVVTPRVIANANAARLSQSSSL
jgi:hypothetical protein